MLHSISCRKTSMIAAGSQNRERERVRIMVYTFPSRMANYHVEIIVLNGWSLAKHEPLPEGHLYYNHSLSFQLIPLSHLKNKKLLLIVNIIFWNIQSFSKIPFRNVAKIQHFFFLVIHFNDSHWWSTRFLLLPYKVVPPSYKLVYNAINYRYIYHKS